MAATTDLPSNGSDPRTVGPVYENLPLLRADSGASDVRRAVVDVSCQSRRRHAAMVVGAIAFLCLTILVITFAGSDVWGVSSIDRREDTGASSASGTDKGSAMAPAFLSSQPASGLRDLFHGHSKKKGEGHDEKRKKGNIKGHHKHQKHHGRQGHHGKGHGKKAEHKNDAESSKAAKAKAKANAKAKAKEKAKAARAAAKAQEEYDEAVQVATRAKEKAEAAKAAEEAKEKAEAAEAAAEIKEKAEAAKAAAEAKKKAEAAKAAAEAKKKAEAASKLKAAETASAALHQSLANATAPVEDKGKAEAETKAQSTTENPFTNTTTTETIVTDTSTQVTTTATTTTPGPFECQSGLQFPTILHPGMKGVALDDATMSGCPSLINVKWPNTKTNITSIRLFKAWDKGWNTNLSRHHIWGKLREFTYRNNAKILYGTMISCDEKQDDEDWKMVQELMKYIGKDHVMGLGIGNEIELLHFKKSTPKDCPHRIWRDGYFLRKVMSRSRDLDAMPGFEGITLTTSMGGYVLTALPADKPGAFVDIPEASVLTFLKQVIGAFGRRWAFTWNIYPYFDPNLVMDGNSYHTCNKALMSAVNFAAGSAGPTMLRVMRQRIHQLTGKWDDVMWVGETGWSSPRADTLETAVGNGCGKPWSAIEVFQLYYQNFLEWDMTRLDKMTKGPDHAFFFSLRDSINFGDREYFGLESDCHSQKCKIQLE